MKNIPAKLIVSLVILCLIIISQIDFSWREDSPGHLIRQVGPLKLEVDRSYPLAKEVQKFSRTCTGDHQKRYTVSRLKGESQALFVWCDGRPSKYQELPIWWDFWFSEAPEQWPVMPKASPAIAPGTMAGHYLMTI